MACPWVATSSMRTSSRWPARCPGGGRFSLSSPHLSGRPALLFDLGCTLVDSVYQHVLAWRDALEGEGFHLSVCRAHRRIRIRARLLLPPLLRGAGHARPPPPPAPRPQ